MVPATFDVQERAALAVRGLTGITDAEKDYEVYWWVDVGAHPPYMVHRPNDMLRWPFIRPCLSCA